MSGISLIPAIVYVCLSLQGREAMACGEFTASEPPRRVMVFEQACGFHAWPYGSTYVDCGQKS